MPATARPLRALPTRRRAAAVCLALVVPIVASPASAQGPQADLAALRTRAEATGWIETSRYEDVTSFLEVVAEQWDRARLTTMGYTWEGRTIPLLVVGDVADASPEAVRASDKVRVYLQGDIHGGEVPGKEALLMLVRDMALGQDTAWLSDLVLLVAPLYNADGNERVALGNRPRQHGPLGGMGQRPNAQGYDLNRDHMKLDSPEARSLVAMMNAYDPHVAVDLHTTNGTRHAYHLTYSPPLHPGTAASVVDLLRGRVLPFLDGYMADRDMLAYYYGNVYDRGDGPGWYTFDHRPRFNNNYVGLRNRLAILSEAYAYLTFRERVEATRTFVEGILTWTAAQTGEVRGAVQAAEAERVVGRTWPVRSTFQRSDTMVTILMGEVAEERHPWTGEVVLRRLPVRRPERMWEYGTFEPTDSEMAPTAYLVPPELAGVVERLEAHGVHLERLEGAEERSVQVFALDSATTAERPFQGHRERRLFGAWSGEVRRTVPAGAVEIRVDQPLGRLAFHLLEPRSDDGLANWGLLDEALEGAGEYPILRVPPPER